jgi:hypothetical protein
MNSLAIVQPGDKAIVYLNTYNLNFSREKPWDKSGGDYLGLPVNRDFKPTDGKVPEGLQIRTQQEMTNIGGRAIFEVTNGGYELLETVMCPSNEPGFENTLLRLDKGEAQMLLTYASMLPDELKENNIPTENILARARDNGWRLGLISLFANPFSLITSRSDYIHFGEDNVGVMVVITDPLHDDLFKSELEKPKSKNWFRR